jgi:ubiquitin C-terminal hydrolase
MSDNKLVEIPALGFYNTGNICYFNALLQCLLGSKYFQKESININEKFKEFYVNIKPKVVCNGSQCYLEAPEERNKRWDKYFSTKLLNDMHEYQGNQSASEYFLKLIDYLNLDSLFTCDYSITRKCSNCFNIVKSKDKSSVCLINDSLNEFFESEDIVDNVICDKCKNKTHVIQSRLIQNISPVVVICLNKYYAKKSIIYGQSFQVNNINYKLIGVVLHKGVLGAGHYLSLVTRHGKQYIIDDDNVYEYTDIEKSFVETYMLFYEREM